MELYWLFIFLFFINVLAWFFIEQRTFDYVNALTQRLNSRTNDLENEVVRLKKIIKNTTIVEKEQDGNFIND